MNRRGFIAGLVAAVVAGPASLQRKSFAQAVEDAGGFRKVSKDFAGHCLPINISLYLGREQINELGRKAPYYRFCRQWMRTK